MSHVGIDLEQFTADPQGSGIQRVLQYLAREWPSEIVTCDFVVPFGNEFLLLDPGAADELVSLAFSETVVDLRSAVRTKIEGLSKSHPRVAQGTLLSLYTAWLLPEVSYLSSVLDRFSLFARCMTTGMIGYDALPMTEPINYRFKPGKSETVSEYFRLLTQTDVLVCISEHSRRTIIERLRRERTFSTTVADPGGDHIPIRDTPREIVSPITFLRVGTMEARKFPRELVAAFRLARAQGVEAQLHFVGRPSASDARINAEVQEAVGENIGVRWTTDASDVEVHEHIEASDVFLSFGSEGYGIPVLEAIRRGLPVLFGGVQPAAELMVGSGAFDVHGTTEQHLVEMFRTFSDISRLKEAQLTVDPHAVPTWRDFAQSVAHAVR